MKKIILAVAAAALAIMAVASSALAGTQAPTTCTPTGFVWQGVSLTAAQIGGNVNRQPRRDRLRHRRLLRPRNDRIGCLGEDLERQVLRRRQLRRERRRQKQPHHEDRRQSPRRHAVRRRDLLHDREQSGGDRHRHRHDQREHRFLVPEGRDHRSRRRRIGDGPAQHGDRLREGRLHRPERDPGLVRRERDGQGEHRLRQLLHGGRHRLRPAPLPGRKSAVTQQANVLLGNQTNLCSF